MEIRVRAGGIEVGSEALKHFLLHSWTHTTEGSCSSVGRWRKRRWGTVLRCQRAIRERANRGVLDLGMWAPRELDDS